MPHAFHTRLTDEQTAVIDTVRQIKDPITGLPRTVSRQAIVSSILDIWMALRKEQAAHTKRRGHGKNA